MAFKVLCLTFAALACLNTVYTDEHNHVVSRLVWIFFDNVASPVLKLTDLNLDLLLQSSAHTFFQLFVRS